MAKKLTGPRVLTANLLGDGMSVFLDADGAWQRSLQDAHVAHSEDEAAALEAKGAQAERANIVVAPYLIAVEETDGGLVPAAFRERRRIEGPSVKQDFNSRSSGHAIAAE